MTATPAWERVQRVMRDEWVGREWTPGPGVRAAIDEAAYVLAAHDMDVARRRVQAKWWDAPPVDMRTSGIKTTILVTGARPMSQWATDFDRAMFGIREVEPRRNIFRRALDWLLDG